MQLIAVWDRIGYERGEGKEYEEVRILTPDGDRLEILSINWDSERGEWVIIGE